MPDDKKQQKRNDPKDQRRPKHGRRNDAKATEKKHEKIVEETKEVPKVLTKPTYQEPRPEFYKNLKRETDEILKIAEEESNKYKKKEIQSNWSKYEMPVETYEDIEEQENMGADYEKLIEAPLTIGGHFQFKHEKTWDTDTGPTPYDKYFDINMDALSLALSTIPFYERNNIDKPLFTETDLTNMNNRAKRYKQKYYSGSKHRIDDDTKSPHLEIQEKILKDLKSDFVKEEISDDELNSNLELDSTETITADINIESNETVIAPNQISDVEVKEIIEPKIDIEIKENPKSKVDEDDFIFAKIEELQPKPEVTKSEIKVLDENKFTTKPTTNPPENNPKEKSNPVIESPEDLEKWLDDFLEG